MTRDHYIVEVCDADQKYWIFAGRADTEEKAKDIARLQWRAGTPGVRITEVRHKIVLKHHRGSDSPGPAGGGGSTRTPPDPTQ